MSIFYYSLILSSGSTKSKIQNLLSFYDHLFKATHSFCREYYMSSLVKVWSNLINNDWYIIKSKRLSVTNIVYKTTYIRENTSLDKLGVFLILYQPLLKKTVTKHIISITNIIVIYLFSIIKICKYSMNMKCFLVYLSMNQNILLHLTDMKLKYAEAILSLDHKSDTLQ